MGGLVNLVKYFLGRSYRGHAVSGLTPPADRVILAMEREHRTRDGTMLRKMRTTTRTTTTGLRTGGRVRVRLR